MMIALIKVMMMMMMIPKNDGTNPISSLSLLSIGDDIGDVAYMMMMMMIIR